MSSVRTIGIFLLDSAVALVLWLLAIAASGLLSELLPPAFAWLNLAIYYLAVSPVAFYARWRGHISFHNSDVVIFLAVPIIFGAFTDLLLTHMAAFPFVAAALFSVLFRFRSWYRRSIVELRRPTMRGH